jgi:folate-dependent phosphoribosylglycinamide formyltransferase PurN
VRIVILTIESLPSNVITATLMRELPGSVVGIVASTALERGISLPRSLWRRMRRMGPRFCAIVTAHGLMTRALWRRHRMRRGSTLPPDLRALAGAAGIPLVGTRDINRAGTIDALRAMTPDLLVSIYFNQRIGREVLASVSGGAINLHPAMLPQNRGPSPNFWVIAEGENHTGVTVHWIDEGIDSGDLILQREVVVPSGTSVSALIGIVVRPGAMVLVEALRLMEAGRAPRQAQDPRMATYRPFPQRQDLRRLRRVGAHYGSAFELVAACESSLAADG